MAVEAGAEQAATETEAAPSGQPVDIEARAFRMGWRPKDQYKGPEADWIPAEQFVEPTEGGSVPSSVAEDVSSTDHSGDGNHREST